MKISTERKQFIRAFLPMLAVFLIPIIAVIISALALPAVYDGTFVGELSEKYDRLNSIDEPKIVIVGGSSAAFGIDSKMISDELGYDVVNFGLYANLGTKLMMDLSKTNINEGDIIILAPELNAQTLSLYFNQETAAQALDGSFYMLRDVDSEDYESLIGAMWGLGSQKLRYHTTKTRPENAGAYRKENFNEYGDNVYDRPYNILSGSGNAITLDFITDYTDNVTTEYEEYVDYVNDYVEYAEKRGASVYFSFPPMNEQALTSSTDGIRAFYQNLIRSLNCKVISNIYDYILDDGYFYDSEFHLNNSGVVVRTVRLIDDIKRELGNDSVTLSASELPSPSGKRPDCDDFELRRLSNARAWAIYGVTETGAAKSHLTIPDEVGGIPVTAVYSGAFSGSDVTLVTLGRNVRRIDSGAFDRTAKLVGVVIPEGAAPEWLDLPEDIGSGSADGFKIFVAPSEYDRFLAAENLSSVRSLIAIEESFEYSTEGNRAVIIGLSESGKLRSELTIPDTHDGVPVTGIAERAFEDADILEKLTLGKNVTNIAEYAFKGTLSGFELHIPAGVSVNALNIPRDPYDLGGSGLVIYVDWTDYDAFLASTAFADYGDSLTTDNLYLELEKAADGSWTVVGINERGRGLTELTIPDEVSGAAVRTVAENAFSGTQITTLNLGRGISRLDGGAFRGSNLETVLLPDGVGAGDISVPNNMSEALATDGCRAGLHILVDPSLYSEFVSDYFWGDYGKYLGSK